MALAPKKPGAADSEKEEAAPDSESAEGDYKQIAKDAAKDGDWDAMVDALCAYYDGGK